MKKIHFLSGIPRSGSTVLASLLNQNPQIHASSTSALLNLLISQSNSIQENKKIYDIKDVQEINVYKGIIKSFYEHVSKKTILDKHRGWPNLINPLKKMGIEPKIICTNRPIPEVIASYLALLEKNPQDDIIEKILNKKHIEINLQNKCAIIWEEYVKIPHSILKNAILENRENLLILDYEKIVKEPLITLKKIYDFLDIEVFDGHQFENIFNNQIEKDDGWGIKGLHQIRTNLKKISQPPEDLMGKDIVDYFSQFNL